MYNNTITVTLVVVQKVFDVNLLFVFFINEI